jgi:hypothetical protein
MHKSLRFLAAAGLIGGGCWLTSAWGQQSRPPADPASPANANSADVPRYPGPVALPDDGQPGQNSYGVDGVRPQRAFEPPNDGGMGLGRGMGFARGRRKGGEGLKEALAFQAAVEKLRSAKEGAEKEAAKKELSQLLEQSFTRDLEHREQDVAEIESRVKKLREQIERRKKAKDEIVGLRLKTIVNETEGLGFPGSQSDEPMDISRKSPTPAARIDLDFVPGPTPVPDGR